MKLVYVTITLFDSLGFGMVFRTNVLTSKLKMHSLIFFFSPFFPSLLGASTHLSFICLLYSDGLMPDQCLG